VDDELLYEAGFSIIGDDFDHAGEASRHIKTILKLIDLPKEIVRRAALIAYEAEINIAAYARKGIIRLSIVPDYIIVEAIDEGQGIPDLELALQPGWSTASQKVRDMGFGAGMGLCNIKSFSDKFHIESEVDKGTYLKSNIALKGHI
jgi:serine/threonine-protein kinase RsbT